MTDGSGQGHCDQMTAELEREAPSLPTCQPSPIVKSWLWHVLQGGDTTVERQNPSTGLGSPWDSPDGNSANGWGEECLGLSGEATTHET